MGSMHVLKRVMSVHVKLEVYQGCWLQSVCALAKYHCLGCVSFQSEQMEMSWVEALACMQRVSEAEW